MIQELRRESVITDEGVLNYYKTQEENYKEHTLILVHGAMETGLVFEQLATRFPDHNVILLDLPGHGFSGGSAKDTVEGYTDSVVKTVVALQAENKITGDITLIGHSMGGSISLEAAKRNLSNLKSIIMISSSFKWDNLPFETAQLVADLEVTKALVASEFTSSANQEDKDFLDRSFDRYIVKDSALRINDFNAVLKYNSEDTLKDIQVPVLAISGDKDHLALAENQVIMNRAIPSCSVALLANQGHDAVMTPSAVDNIATIIKEFFGYSSI